MDSEDRNLRMNAAAVVKRDTELFEAQWKADLFHKALIEARDLLIADKSTEAQAVIESTLQASVKFVPTLTDVEKQNAVLTVLLTAMLRVAGENPNDPPEIRSVITESHKAVSGPSFAVDRVRRLEAIAREVARFEEYRRSERAVRLKHENSLTASLRALIDS
jgi:hypothetical protein